MKLYFGGLNLHLCKHNSEQVQAFRKYTLYLLIYVAKIWELNFFSILFAHNLKIKVNNRINMSKRLSKEDKLVELKNMCKSFEKEQVEHLEQIANVDARYKCAQRFMRKLNKGQKEERLRALELYRRYAEILEGLECIDDKLWTDEKKIKAFSNLLDTYADKCVKLVEENNRKHLERLIFQRDQHRKEYEEVQAKYDNQIAELQEKLR